MSKMTKSSSSYLHLKSWNHVKLKQLIDYQNSLATNFTSIDSINLIILQALMFQPVYANT